MRLFVKIAPRILGIQVLCRQIEEKELEIVIDRTGRRNIQDRILGISFHPVRL